MTKRKHTMSRILRISMMCVLGLALIGCSDDGGSRPPDQGGPGPDRGAPDRSGPNPDQGSAGFCEKKCTDQAAYLCVTDPATKKCVECLKNTHCAQNPGAAGAVCDTASMYCGCSAGGDCAGKAFGKKCHGTEGVCSCTVAADCSGGLECIGNFFGTKVCKKPCAKNADCAANMFEKICDTKTGCQECLKPGDCGPATLGNACTNGLCTCAKDGDCTGKTHGKKCLTSNSCGCDNDFDCPTGKSCTGIYLSTKICK